MFFLQRRDIKKVILSLAFSLMLWNMPARAQQLPGVKLGSNLVSNPGFENGTAGWVIPENTFKVVNDVAHNGKDSLCYTNSNPQQEERVSQRLEVKAGQHLHFSIWVKGEDIVEHDNPLDKYPSPGVNLYFESYDAQGNSINVFDYRRLPGSILKTYEWEEVRREYIVPEKATSIAVGFYMRKGLTGKVWVDDVKLQIQQRNPVVSFLQFPNYRNMVKHGDNTPWKVSLRLDPLPEEQNSTIEVRTSLKDNRGKVLLTKEDHLSWNPTETQLTFNPPDNLPVGKYQLHQTFLSAAGNQISEATYPIQVVPQMPEVYIDAQGFTVASGKRFFPLGLYLNPATDEDLKRISQAGFNTILSYLYGNNQTDPLDYLDRAYNHQLKVVYSLKDMYPGMNKAPANEFENAAGYIKKLRHKPALLSWYINDELQTGWLPKLQKMYDQVVWLDPEHPALQLSNQPTLMEQYFNVADIFATDPYPVNSPYPTNGPALTSTAIYTRLISDAAHGAKGVWLVPQIMDWNVYHNGVEGHQPHQPTLDEMREQAYASIITGAKGLIFYSYFDLWFADDKRQQDKAIFEKRWPDVIKLGSEIKKIIPVLLDDNKVNLTLPPSPQMYAGAWKYQDELLILLANPYYKNNSITLEIPKGWKVESANQGEIKSTFSDNQITFEVPPVGSGVFHLMKE